MSGTNDDWIRETRRIGGMKGAFERREEGGELGKEID